MLRLAPTTRLLQAPLRGWVVPKAHISAKPARTPTSPKEQAVGLSAMFLSFLLPAGWVLFHMENYKRSSVA
ncbi:Cytochrome c oxidase subunit 8B; mitochondrial [Camelus dromedarius]|uniref:Cytochrome c oxidase subunit 8 n=2 Tax=Camelus TaxID=9836 RepID=A0A5N4BY06_CAMDR|nr:Cytochrome c oxidase subunit 8B; mitochondrial [Camelus dromedarius]